MIGAVVLVSLLAWGMFRLVRSGRTATTVAVPKLRITGEKSSRGLEDDPALWASAQGAWTVLDELQLTRLLRESSKGPEPKPADENASRLDRDETP